MEEPKPDQDQPTQTQAPTPTPTPDPPSTATTPPPPPPPPPPQPPATPPKSKKRPLDTNVQIQDTKYYKMRVVLKDLHPYIFEVLRTPDFRNCKAAHEIQEQIKLLMELYKEMMAERVSSVKSKTVPESQLSSGDNGVGQKPQEQLPDVKPAEQPQPDNPFQSGIVFEKQRPEDGEAQGTYIVGGSAFGWNFITFASSKPVYYGVTKESFRSAQMNAGES